MGTIREIAIWLICLFFATILVCLSLVVIVAFIWVLIKIGCVPSMILILGAIVLLLTQLLYKTTK